MDPQRDPPSHSLRYLFVAIEGLAGYSKPQTQNIRNPEQL